MIIWGTRGITSTAQTGVFYCPRCGPHRPYALRRVRRWFTLYFLPVIPLDVAGQYVECQQCAGTFGTDVLRYDPAAAQRQIIEQIERVLVLAMLASGPPTEARVATLQQTVAELTDVHVTAEEVWREIRMAQDASAPMAPFVQGIAPGFTDVGKQKLLAGAHRILAAPGGVTPPDEAVLRQLGAALAVDRSLLEVLLQKLKTIA